MPEKDPTLWSEATWLLMMAMSLLGGLSSWYRRIKSDNKFTFSIVEFIGEMSLSGLMGFSGFVFADWYFDSTGIAAAFAGMAAHFSVRLLFSAEGILVTATRKIEKTIRDRK